MAVKTSAIAVAVAAMLLLAVTHSTPVPDGQIYTIYQTEPSSGLFEQLLPASLIVGLNAILSPVIAFLSGLGSIFGAGGLFGIGATIYEFIEGVINSFGPI